MSELYFTNRPKDPPDELTSVGQWIVWRFVDNDDGGKPRKVPSTPGGHNLKSWQKPGQWLSYHDAKEALKADRNGEQALSGLGFVLTKDTGIIGVDIDGCIDSETGDVADWAQAHLDDFKGTYAEISPSGTGLRMFALGALPDGCRKHSGHREIYDSGRWLTITGNVLHAQPITAQPEGVARYLDAMQPDGERTPQTGAQDATQGDIPEGGRNNALASIAGHLRHDGLSRDEIGAALHAVNAGRCTPPLPDAEVETIAASVCRYAPGMDAAQAVAAPGDFDDYASGMEPYTLLSFGDMLAMPPIEWRVKGVLPTRGLAQIFGASRAGKSFLAIDMACAIAEGQDWFGYSVNAAPVVYIVLEGTGGFPGRLKAWQQQHDGRTPENLSLIVEPFQFDTSHVRRLIEAIPKGAVIFVDTQSRATVGLEENSAKDMGRVVDLMARIADGIQGIVINVAHTGVSAEAQNRARGSSSQLAAMDAQINVARGDDDQRTWTLTKSKDGRDGLSHGFILSSVGIGADDDGEPVTSCVIVRDDRERKKKWTPTPTQREVIDAYDRACLTSAVTNDEGQVIGVSREDWRLAHQSISVAENDTTKRRRFDRALISLRDAGQLEVYDGTLKLVDFRAD